MTSENRDSHDVENKVFQLADATKECLRKVQDVEELEYIVSLDLYLHTDGDKTVIRPEIGYSKDGLPTKFFKGPRYGVQNMENYDVEVTK